MKRVPVLTLGYVPRDLAVLLLFYVARQRTRGNCVYDEALNHAAA